MQVIPVSFTSANISRANLDDRVKNPDQMITHDIQKFSNNLAAIYSNLAKPVLDVILYNYQLSQSVGAEGLVLLTVLVQLSAALCKNSCITFPFGFEGLYKHAVRKLTPPFGAYTSMSAQLLGALRHTHSRLVEFAEEIAFFGGEDTEKMLVEREYAGLVMHENRVLIRRWWHGCVEEGIVKWLWGSFGASSIRATYGFSCLCSRDSSSFVQSLSFSSFLGSTTPIWGVGQKVRMCIHVPTSVPHCLLASRLRDESSPPLVLFR